MSTGITCAVTVDGVRLQDGAPGDNLANPTALSGLEVVWGRETTLDQPDPATCTLEVLDLPGGEAFAGKLHVGAQLVVTATGHVYPGDASTSTFLDPSFETTANAVASGGTARASTVRAHTGARSLRLEPADPKRRVGAILPPAPFDGSGDPAAWDTIPATALGQTWSVGAAVFAPPGARVELRPVMFASPFNGDWRVINQPKVVFGSGAWLTPSAPFVPDAAGQWVGVEVSVYPTGPWQAAPGAWAGIDPTLKWADMDDSFVDDVAVLTPSAGTARTVAVFAGRITDVEGAFDATHGGPVMKVTALDFTADLDNTDITHEYIVGQMTGNVADVLARTGLPITYQIDARPAQTFLSWHLAENQPAADLLRSYATSTDATMWPAVHPLTGAYLRFEDAGGRAGYRLELVDGVVVVTVTGQVVSACDVLRDSVAFVQSVSDIVTRVGVDWLEQLVDDKGNPDPEKRTVVQANAALEATHGVRRLQVGTILQSAADATANAGRILARADTGAWRIETVTIDDYDTSDVSLMLDLVDGTRRIGLPLQLVDMPEWAPLQDASLYVEGGSLLFENGRWVSAAAVSRAYRNAVTWAQLDLSWRWVDLDPAITWAALNGVAGPEE